MNKIEIEIPVGKEVDWEASAKQKQIVFKDKQLTYEDVCEELFKKDHYYTNDNGNLRFMIGNANDCPNNATTKHQLECILAKNKLANVARYLNGEWVTGKTELGHFNAYVLYLTPNKDYIGWVNIHNCSQNSNVLFKSSELAQLAIQILGKKTIKLALEPLY
jgi:hypothetical protein